MVLEVRLLQYLVQHLKLFILQMVLQMEHRFVEHSLVVVAVEDKEVLYILEEQVVVEMVQLIQQLELQEQLILVVEVVEVVIYLQVLVVLVVQELC